MAKSTASTKTKADKAAEQKAADEANAGEVKIVAPAAPPTDEELAKQKQEPEPNLIDGQLEEKIDDLGTDGAVNDLQKDPNEQIQEDPKDNEPEVKKSDIETFEVIHNGVLPQHDVVVQEQFVIGLSGKPPVNTVLLGSDLQSKFVVVYQADQIAGEGNRVAYTFLIKPIYIPERYVDKSLFEIGKTFSVFVDPKIEK